MSKEMFSEVFQILKIFFTLPATTETAERTDQIVIEDIAKSL